MRFHGLALCSTVALAIGCARVSSGRNDDASASGGAGSSAVGAGGRGGSGGTGGSAGPPSFDDRDAGIPQVDGAGADASCAAANAMASLVREPVDIIVVVDNSGSMTNEIQAVEQNIGLNFAGILATSGIDYRVILIARHGSAQRGQSICISMPLSGAASCATPPPTPVNGPRFFHYSVEIGSHDSFSQVLTTYARPDEFNLAPQGWSQWLRAGAHKVFLEITDDEATDLTSAQFDTMLLALDPAMFGTATARRYTFHSITGLIENSPPTAAWPPTAPVQMATCTGNGGDVVAAGAQYQQVSVLTAGLRFPLCQYASFDVVFKAIAAEVVSGSRIACEFPIPRAPNHQSLDLNKVAVAYTPGDGSPSQTFAQAMTAERCVSDAFYVAAGSIVLCPSSCAKIQQDALAKVDVLFTCKETIIP
jgi:hypothetical protein